jgi:hypothetical protein
MATSSILRQSLKVALNKMYPVPGGVECKIVTRRWWTDKIEILTSRHFTIKSREKRSGAKEARNARGILSKHVAGD